MMHLDRERKPLTAPGRTISGNTMSTTRCLVCLGPCGQGKKTCSPHCRLIKWGAHALLEAYRTGRADGLSDIIRKLFEVKR